MNQESRIITLIALLFLPIFAHAAALSFDKQQTGLAVGQEFIIPVQFDGSGTSVNALEGAVRFQNDLLELIEVRDGGSSINFWIEKPKATTTGAVRFSGITAGGLPSQKTFIFSLVFKAKQAGRVELAFENVQALQNDGLGTPVRIDSERQIFEIAASGTVVGTITLDDMDPPESFVPFIGNDATLFEGRYFLVFSTQDKKSGVDHYEVREGLWGDYVTAESPYILTDQSLGKRVYVKAIDKKGNEIVVKVATEHTGGWYRYGLVIGIILLIWVFLYTKKRRASVRKY